MASIQYSVLRVVSTLGGLALVGVAAFLNVHHAAESEGTYGRPCASPSWHWPLVPPWPCR